MLKLSILFGLSFGCIVLAAVIPTTPNPPLLQLSTLDPFGTESWFNETQRKEIENFRLCNDEMKSMAKCTDQLPPDMRSQNDFEHKMKAHPDEYCCLAYSALLCEVQSLEHMETCKKVMNLEEIKKLLEDGLKDLTNKYHCQLKNCIL